LINPLFVPTQIIPGTTVDADIDSAGPPRSGLIAVQCTPPSVVVQIDWKPAMSIC